MTNRFNRVYNFIYNFIYYGLLINLHEWDVEERMEFFLSSFDGALPVEVTLDDDNGRYTIRKSDTSGEFFNSSNELIEWIKSNFQEHEFCHPHEYRGMLAKLAEYELEGQFL